jgi:hypothetical protein
MVPATAAVFQDAGISAAGILKGVRQDRHAIEGVDGPSEGNDGAVVQGETRRIDGDMSKQRDSQDATKDSRAFTCFGRKNVHPHRTDWHPTSKSFAPLTGKSMMLCRAVEP